MASNINFNDINIRLESYKYLADSLHHMPYQMSRYSWVSQKQGHMFYQSHYSTDLSRQNHYLQQNIPGLSFQQLLIDE